MEGGAVIIAPFYREKRRSMSSEATFVGLASAIGDVDDDDA